jgi:hypothetical protein
MKIKNERPELENATTETAATAEAGANAEIEPTAEAETEPTAEAETERSAESEGAAEPTASIPESPAESDGWPRCPWCSSPTPPGAQNCPSCQAALVSYAEDQGMGIPGVTEVDPSLRDYKPGPRKPQKIADLLIKLLEPEALGEPASPAPASSPEAAPAADPEETAPEAGDDSTPAT